MVGAMSIWRQAKAPLACHRDARCRGIQAGEFYWAREGLLGAGPDPRRWLQSGYTASGARAYGGRKRDPLISD